MYMQIYWPPLKTGVIIKIIQQCIFIIWIRSISTNMYQMCSFGMKWTINEAKQMRHYPNQIWVRLKTYLLCHSSTLCNHKRYFTVGETHRFLICLDQLGTRYNQYAKWWTHCQSYQRWSVTMLKNALRLRISSSAVVMCTDAHAWEVKRPGANGSSRAGW